MAKLLDISAASPRSETMPDFKNPAANLVSQSETNVIAPNTRTLAASMRISAALKPANIGIFDMGTFSVPDTAGQ